MSMHFTTEKEHRDAFNREGAVEFFEIIPPAQAQYLSNEIDTVLSHRLKVSHRQLELQRADSLFLHGHDLWRASDSVRKFVCNRIFASIAFELVNIKPIRIGYDQLLLGGSYLRQETTVQEFSSIQHILCGLVICLNDGEERDPETEERYSIFPQHAGNACFFRANHPIDFSALTRCKEQRFLMITYTGAKAVYARNENDQHTASLKKEGYNFGDRLNDKLHPIVYK
ncbi:MAG: hypothetical protein H7A37_10040 [Chlamydiales bacterium]|nr:hypothetical protein [Chlamydiia bacterium]MCP5508616.1 hypothetical protein [Chlamydiales bacterium]